MWFRLLCFVVGLFCSCICVHTLAYMWESNRKFCWYLSTNADECV